jgi:hypothetical protein
MENFLQSLRINLVTLFECKSRRQRYDSNFYERQAFRVCIYEDDVDKLLQPDQWPYGVVISEWYFMNGDNDGMQVISDTDSVPPVSRSAFQSESAVSDTEQHHSPVPVNRSANSDSSVATVIQVTPPSMLRDEAVVSTPLQPLHPTVADNVESASVMDCSDICATNVIDSGLTLGGSSDPDATILTSYVTDQNG